MLAQIKSLFSFGELCRYSSQMCTLLNPNLSSLLYYYPPYILLMTVSPSPLSPLIIDHHSLTTHTLTPSQLSRSPLTPSSLSLSPHEFFTTLTLTSSSLTQLFTALTLTTLTSSPLSLPHFLTSSPLSPSIPCPSLPHYPCPHHYRICVATRRLWRLTVSTILGSLERREPPLTRYARSMMCRSSSQIVRAPLPTPSKSQDMSTRLRQPATPS